MPYTMISFTPGTVETLCILGDERPSATVAFLILTWL